jgi:hypothetical protein
VVVMATVFALSFVSIWLIAKALGGITRSGMPQGQSTLFGLP